MISKFSNLDIVLLRNIWFDISFSLHSNFPSSVSVTEDLSSIAQVTKRNRQFNTWWIFASDWKQVSIQHFNYSTLDVLVLMLVKVWLSTMYILWKAKLSRRGLSVDQRNQKTTQLHNSNIGCYNIIVLQMNFIGTHTSEYTKIRCLCACTCLVVKFLMNQYSS